MTTNKCTGINDLAVKWMQMQRDSDCVSAAKLIQDKRRLFAQLMRSMPSELEKWMDIVRRSTVPTREPTCTLFDAYKCVLEAKKELMIFGSADPHVAKILLDLERAEDVLMNAFGDAYFRTNREIHLLGHDLAEALFPDWEVDLTTASREVRPTR